MTNQFQPEIVAAIEKHQTIILHRHVNPDGDALGSQLGLKAILQANFPQKAIYATGEKKADQFPFLPAMDQVPDEAFASALVIVTDTANSSRIDDSRWQQAAMVIKIDHHPVKPDNPEYHYPDYAWIEPDAPAACQLVILLARKNNWKLPLAAAQYLFLGLVTDTGRFMYDTTSPTTFKLVSELTAQPGFKLSTIYHPLYQKTTTTARLQGYILSHFVIEHQVAYLLLKPAVLKKLGVDRVQATAQVNILAHIAGVKIWAIFAQDQPQTEIKGSLRSAMNTADVNVIAAHFNGGGHQQAAGVRLKTWTEVNKLLSLCYNS